MRLWKTKGTAAIRHMCMDRVKVNNITVPTSKRMFPFQNSFSPLDKDSDVLLHPKPQLQLKNKNLQKENAKFFVLTSQECYQYSMSENCCLPSITMPAGCKTILVRLTQDVDSDLYARLLCTLFNTLI